MKHPSISVIIPSGSRERAETLRRLVQDVEEQSVGPVEVVVVHGISPNGRARNVGVQRASGELLVFMDDDVRLGSKDVLSGLVTQLENPSIGMAGTAQLLPFDSTRFQKHAAAQIPRSSSEVVQLPTDSDMVTTACCAIRRSVLEQVGGFHDTILRGVDPELRDRVRKAGLRIVIAPHIWHSHPMPSHWKALLRMAWRNGYSSAFAQKHFPETVLFNPEGHVAEFEARPGLSRRLVRRAGELLQAIGRGRVYGTAYDLAYAGGFAWFWLRLRLRHERSSGS